MFKPKETKNISLNTVILREGSQVRAALPAKTQMDFKPTVEARGKERRGSKKGVENGENSVCYGGGEFLQLKLDKLDTGIKFH